jgi:peptidoglycan hydrolase CwlO-like protein
MIEGILADLTVELVLVSLGLTSTLVMAVYTNRQDIKKIKQRLFGLELDDADEGHIKESNEKLSELDEKMECIDEELTDMQKTLESIESKIDRSNISFSADDDD